MEPTFQSNSQSVFFLTELGLQFIHQPLFNPNPLTLSNNLLSFEEDILAMIIINI